MLYIFCPDFLSNILKINRLELSQQLVSIMPLQQAPMPIQQAELGMAMQIYPKKQSIMVVKILLSNFLILRT